MPQVSLLRHGKVTTPPSQKESINPRDNGRPIQALRGPRRQVFVAGVVGDGKARTPASQPSRRRHGRIPDPEKHSARNRIERQKNPDHCPGMAASLARSKQKPPGMPIDNLPADPKAKAGPQRSLGGKERLERLLGDSGRHSRARVRNRDRQSFSPSGPILPFLASEDQAPSRQLHGIQRIPGDIVQHLANLPLKTTNSCIRSEALLHLNIRIDDSSLKQRKNALNELLARNFLRICRLLVEAKSLIRNRRGTASSRSAI